MNLHPVACTRCRSYKRRCSRELPTCDRCRRLGFDCGYLPARRKLLAERPSRNGLGWGQGKSSLLRNGHLATEVNGLMLFDSYFSLFIPSTFIFHQPHVKRDFIEGSIPTFVRDSIFSIALLLLETKTARTHYPLDEAPGRVRTKPPAEFWAERANMAATQAFRPTLDKVQAYYNLAAYWCAVGKTQKLKEAAKNAMQSAEQVVVSSPRLSPGGASELKQSCFWIAMTCRSLLSNDEVIASFSSMLEEQLPIREEGFPHHPEIVLGSDIRGNIMKIVVRWLKTRQFVNGLDGDAHPGTQLATLASLDTNVCRLYEALPPQHKDFNGLHCDKESEFDDNVSLQALYHLCRILPHLAMVGFLEQKEPWAKAHIQQCSKIAILHINRISEIFMNCIFSRHAFRSALPPFVAYCSLVASSVYLRFVKAIQSRSKGSESYRSPAFRLLRSRLLSNLHLLNQSRKFWAPVRAMWSVLQADMNDAGISDKDIDEFLKETRVLFEWTTPTSNPPVSICPQRQAEYFMVTNLPQVMGSIVLFDPGYILAGKLESFSLGAKPKELTTSPPNKGSSSGSLDPSTDLLLMRSRTWKLPLHSSTQGPQQTRGASTHSNHHIETERRPKKSPLDSVPNVNRETPLPNPEDDPIAVMGMMEMMWLDGSELLM